MVKASGVMRAIVLRLAPIHFSWWTTIGGGAPVQLFPTAGPINTRRATHASLITSTGVTILGILIVTLTSSTATINSAGVKAAMPAPDVLLPFLPERLAPQAAPLEDPRGG